MLRSPLLRSKNIVRDPPLCGQLTNSATTPPASSAAANRVHCCPQSIKRTICVRIITIRNDGRLMDNFYSIFRLLAQLAKTSSIPLPPQLAKAQSSQRLVLCQRAQDELSAQDVKKRRHGKFAILLRNESEHAENILLLLDPANTFFRVTRGTS